MRNKGEVLVSSESKGQMWNTGVWDPETGTLLTSYKGGSTLNRTLSMVGTDYMVSAHPDKPLLNVWQINRNEQMSLRMFTPGKCSSLTCSPRGSYLIAAVEEKISVWQVSTGRLWRVLSSHYQPVTCLQFTEDGSYFVSAGGDGQVLCWSIAMVVSRRNLPGVKVSQVGKPEPKWSWRDHALPVTDIHITPGGVNSKVASVSKDQTCKLFCIVSGQLLLSISYPVPLGSVTMDATCDSIYTGGENGSIYVISLNNPPRSVSISSESQGSTVLKGHTDTVSNLSLSLDGSHLSSGSLDTNVRIWHVKSGQCVRVIEHKGAITSLKYMIPPPGMLNTDQWSPGRKLVPLQKGFDEKDSFVSTVLSKETKPFERFEGEEIEVDGETATEKKVENTERIQELMEINNQLYKYSVKHILNQKT